MIDGMRWSVPGDRASILAEGQIVLLGRDSVTINSGGEKIFAEEVERASPRTPPYATSSWPAGRPSAGGARSSPIVQLEDGAEATDEELLAEADVTSPATSCPRRSSGCRPVQRSPSGKADYRWAKAQAVS